MGRSSTLPARLQPMLATLTDAPFDDKEWIFEDKYDGFRMVATIEGGAVTLYSRNGKIISQSYMEIANALEGVKGDAVIDGALVALGKDGASHFQLLQNALRQKAKLLYCATPRRRKAAPRFARGTGTRALSCSGKEYSNGRTERRVEQQR